ncbi:transglutaminaseTgpA domain-containing protein [Deinococcus wulumuqiensis]
MRRPALWPTRFGWAFLGLVLLTLIGCINYALSLGYGLTFLLVGVWIVTAAQARRAARTLSLTVQPPAEAVAGHETAFTAQVRQSGAASPVTLRGWAEQNGQRVPLSAALFVGAGHTQTAALRLSEPVRGPLRLTGVQLVAHDPFGLWQATRTVTAQAQTAVLPAPEADAPAPPTLTAAGSGEAGRRTAGQEDFAGLRPYAAGDAPRLISWRHAARSGQLVTREFDAPLGQALDLNWNAAQGEQEARLSRLAAWAAAARAAGLPFRLTLPGQSLPVGSGDAHALRALRALALHPPFPAPPEQKAGNEFLSRPAWLGGPNTTEAPSAPLPAAPLQFSLLALGVALLPGLLRWPLWASALVLWLLTYRGLQAEPGRRLRALPPPLLLVLVGVAAFGLNATYGTLLGQDGGTALLAALLALKAAETRTVRDARLLTLLGLFVTSTHFFHDQGPLTALHSLLASVLLLAAAARWMGDRGDPAAQAALSPTVPRPLLGLSARLLLLSLPLAALLFVFFPRPDGPLWQLPINQGARTGLADQISAGEYSTLAQSDAVAFRADFGGPLPPPDERYWRGPVYELFDGQGWQQVRGRFAAPSAEARPGAPVWSYSITLEPSGKPWLLALDLPTTLPQSALLTGAFQAATLRPASLRTRYEWNSQAAVLGRQESQERLGLNLTLPETPDAANPQSRALAASWRTLAPEQRVQAGLDVFRKGGFAYTLTPPKLPETNRIDAFLFGSKRGFCEHYSSAFAFLMRAAGVPTRIVGGYQGGEVNPAGGYLIVRQQNAHAWTEVWLQGQGWVRVDPTAAVAPARVQADLGTALTQPQATAPRERTALERATLRLDALQNQWNTWVVSYDGAQQRSLLSRLGVSGTGSPLYLLALLGAAALTLLPALAFVRRRALPRDPALLALHDLSTRLRLPRGPGETPTAYAERAAAHSPQQAPLLRDIARRFNALRYGPHAGPEELRQLQALVRQVRRTERT